MQITINSDKRDITYTIKKKQTKKDEKSKPIQNRKAKTSELPQHYMDTHHCSRNSIELGVKKQKEHRII